MFRLDSRHLQILVAFALVGLTLLPEIASAQVPWTPTSGDFPRTAAEMSGFTRNTRHLEMWDCRELPYAIFSRPLVSEPWEAWALGRPIVVLAANVHGGERTFREGLLILMRDLATPGSAANALLDEVTIIVAPQINPDGFEASERGQRGNAWGSTSIATT